MRAQYRIRRARLKDLPRVLEIENASFGAEAYDRKLFADYYYKCCDLFLVAERRGQVCGYILTCPRGHPPTLRAELISVAVDPALRQGGAASALLGSTLRRLRRRRVTQLRLMVRVTNQPARAFYEKYGFQRVRRIPAYYEDGGDAIAMALAMRPHLGHV